MDLTAMMNKEAIYNRLRMRVEEHYRYLKAGSDLPEHEKADEASRSSA
ncbi:MAG: hypothetical protein AVDCRST_MAG93-5723 [uncultured Chloroflexia bacterium]|uniref:Uncharacterized protein n=1 Tax=uncultured Chloroflexia bacterium TaxID=1672391 RepID=A0A6J4L1R3_9CHLR|nr:MAG: hypothetical protein AVDCRST_MAG93-5723 [uncultured Chloroflexia bacterium]